MGKVSARRFFLDLGLRTETRPHSRKNLRAQLGKSSARRFFLDSGLRTETRPESRKISARVGESLGAQILPRFGVKAGKQEESPRAVWEGLGAQTLPRFSVEQTKGLKAGRIRVQLGKGRDLSYTE